MIRSAAIVICLMVAGDVIAEQYALPFPGAALGLALLTAVFALRGGPDAGSEELFDIAAPYFPLFFVPAAVGVVASVEMLVSSWAYLSLAIIGGTAVTLLATGLICQWLLWRIDSEAKA
jgi:holin-like protein